MWGRGGDGKMRAKRGRQCMQRDFWKCFTAQTFPMKPREGAAVRGPRLSAEVRGGCEGGNVTHRILQALAPLQLHRLRHGGPNGNGGLGSVRAARGERWAGMEESA
jgi:hypothetical protein